MNTGMKTARYGFPIPALILSLIGMSACAMLTHGQPEAERFRK